MNSARSTMANNGCCNSVWKKIQRKRNV